MNPDPDAMTQANDGNAPIPNSATPPAPAVPGWHIGVLYSRSGVSGTTESQHFFGTVLAVEEINALGGVLGAAGAGGLRPAQRARNTAGWPAGCCWTTRST